MVTGIDASITSITDYTTAHASDVLASLNSLNANGVSNDSGQITTDNAGNITATGFYNAGGIIRGINLITPYQLANNPTINNGSSVPYTCTGGSTGVPTGAKGVILTGYYTAGTAGMSISFTPQGSTWNNGNYPLQAAPTAALYSFFIIGTLNASNGQIVVAAGGGNCVGLYMWINGFIY